MTYHVRSHDGGVHKPYICSVCGKGFSRYIDHISKLFPVGRTRTSSSSDDDDDDGIIKIFMITVGDIPDWIFCPIGQSSYRYQHIS